MLSNFIDECYVEHTIEWWHSYNPIDYLDALNLMEQRVEKIIKGEVPETIWFLEHNPVITAGTSANIQDLIDPQKFPVYKTGRGGQYTYHGHGQKIAYIMLNLQKRGFGVREYVKFLEQCLIEIVGYFGIQAFTREGRVGVWIQNNTSEDKIAAIGVRIRKYISFHGFALNISPNLEHFNTIVPCGIKNYGVISLEKVGIKIANINFDDIIKNVIVNKLN
jgi:lipoyl(octanoyl) transferase